MRGKGPAVCVLAALLACAGAGVSAPIVRPGEVLRGDFVQERNLSGFDAPLRAEGRFTLAPDRGLIWHVTEPVTVTTVITSEGLLQRNAEKVLMRLSSARTPLLDRLYDMLGKVLLGEWKSLSPLYHVQRSENENGWRIELRPRKDAAEAAIVSAVAIKGARFAETIEIRKVDGDSDHLRFANQALSAGPLSTEEASLLDSVGQ